MSVYELEKGKSYLFLTHLEDVFEVTYEGADFYREYMFNHHKAGTFFLGESVVNKRIIEPNKILKIVLNAI